MVLVLLTAWFGPAATASDEFSVVVYNVENLFDVDGVALFDDYKPEKYGPAHLLTKVKNTAEILAMVDEGRGPAIIMFQELEADQTPSPTPPDYKSLLDKYASDSLESMLREPLDRKVKDLPSEFFLLKALQEVGLDGYHVAVAEYRPDPTGRVVAHVNATFSRYPIHSVRTHHSPGARGTLEVVHDIHGSHLYSFNNHWKSGASDPESENIRLGNARVVRQRLDELLAKDKHADVIIAGDFNSQFNQTQRYPDISKSAVNDVLGSQGDEARLLKDPNVVLYNLWYEMKPEQRGSDVFRDQWGTLMQIMITRGMYDGAGLQYVDNSFEVLAYENLNAQVGSLLPIRWQHATGVGAGYSDHFPLKARFRHVGGEGGSGEYFALRNASRPRPQDREARPVQYGLVKSAEVPHLTTLGSDQAICDPKHLGHVFLIQAEVSGERPFRLKVFEQEYNLWAFDVALRREVYSRFSVGQSIRFYGEVGIHDGNWQFVVRDVSWLEP